MKSRCRQALAFSENRRSAAIFCFICTDPAGCTNCVSVFVPNGRGVFSLNLSGEWRRLRAARTLRLRAAGAQEGRQPTVFHPLVNLPFSLRGHGEICRVETCKGAAEDFSFRVFLNRFAVPDTGLLHRRVNQRWVRHNSAAQTLNVLCWKAPTQFSGGECLNSQVPCVVTG